MFSFRRDKMGFFNAAHPHHYRRFDDDLDRPHPGHRRLGGTPDGDQVDPGHGLGAVHRHGSGAHLRVQVPARQGRAREGRARGAGAESEQNRSGISFMKVSIIGGGGLVGSMTAYALQCGGVVEQHLPHRRQPGSGPGRQASTSCTAPASPPTSGSPPATMDDVKSSHVVVITAGLRRKPDESRLDLINRNVDLFLGLLDQVKAAGLKEDAYLVVVSNPVDVLTYLAVQRSVCRGSASSAWARSSIRPVSAAFSRGGCSAADAGQRPDPRRARRQHGAGLVERDGSRVAAGAVAGLRRQPAERGVRGNEDGRGTDDQAQGRLRLRASACRSARSCMR